MKFPYKTVIAAGVIIAVILGVYNIYVYFFTGVKTQVVLYGSIETGVSAKGYIVRDEHILVNESGRYLASIASDGDRVSAGTAVAALYSAELDSAVQTELAELNERILNLERVSSLGESVQLDEIGAENAVKENISNIMKYAHYGDGVQLNEVSLLLEEAVDEKIASSAEKSVDVLGRLKARKAELEQSISGEKSDIYTNAAGLYFSHTDGFESLISAEKAHELTPQDIKELDKASVSEKGGASAKIVKSFEWSLAAAVDSKDLSVVKEGDPVKIRFNEFSDESYSAVIEHISGEQEGKRAIVMRSDDYCEYVYYNRRVNADIVFNKSEGLKFSKDAIRVVDSQTGVYILSGSEAKFRAVEVLANDGTDVVVREDNSNASNLLLYDEVVVRGNQYR